MLRWPDRTPTHLVAQAESAGRSAPGSQAASGAPTCRRMASAQGWGGSWGTDSSAWVYLEAGPREGRARAKAGRRAAGPWTRGQAPQALPPGSPADCPEAGHDLRVPGSLSKASWCPPPGALSSPHTPRIPLPHRRSLPGGWAQASPSLLVPASRKVWMTLCSQLFARIPPSCHVVGSTGCAPLDKPVWQRHLGPATQSPQL